MRLLPSLLATIATLSGCATPAPVYVEPAAHDRSHTETAHVYREFCLGGGRGLIHFVRVDGKIVNGGVLNGMPVKVVLAPGQHTLRMFYLAPSKSIFSNFEKEIILEEEFKGNRSYLVRYERTGATTFRAWLQELGENNTIPTPPPAFCFQPEYSDDRYIK